MAVQEIMTPEQVAEYLQVTPETVYRYIRQGKLIASRIGRRYRIPRLNVELFLAATSTVPEGRLRRYTGMQIREFLKEDTLDEETRAKGEKLLAALTQ